MLIFIQGLKNADLQKDLHMKRSANLNEMVKETLYLVDNCTVYKEEDHKDYHDDSSSQGSAGRSPKTNVKTEPLKNKEQLIEEVIKRLTPPMRPKRC